jgi:hypothetical protein
MIVAKLRTAQAAMADRNTRVGDLCRELGITRPTLYRFVGPKGELRADGEKLIKPAERTEPAATPEAGTTILFSWPSPLRAVPMCH